MTTNSYKTILGIETSCDETAASVVSKSNNRVFLLSNIISSSASLQSKYGGIIPEQAAREQIKAMVPVLTEALEEAKITKHHIDAIAVTTGPGLIGSLLVGVETAKILSVLWQKPIIPVNHLVAHFYANWIDTGEPNFNVPQFPALGLLVSGGHTDLIVFKNHGMYEYIGGTRDDAAGECFDKCARLLNLPYPGGPYISKHALEGNSKTHALPRPMIHDGSFDFSFSGLKTAVANNIHQALSEQEVNDYCASIEESIIDVLVTKTIRAAQELGIENIIIAGGVAANRRLREYTKQELSEKLPQARLFIPPPNLCTDNGAIIAAYALYNPYPIDVDRIQANPNISLQR